MKILHVPYTYFPDAVGGTEIYVRALCGSLRELGIQCLVAAPGRENADYFEDTVRVVRFPVPEQVSNIRDLYSSHDADAANRLASLMDEEEPDVIHVHAFGRGSALSVVATAAARDIPTVFTYHTPTVSCPRATLMKWGEEVCDGRLDVRQCSACVLQGHGLNRLMSFLLGNVPNPVSKFLTMGERSGGAWTALRMTELLNLRFSTLLEFLRKVGHVIAPCRWVRQLLEINGVPADKITLSRQGLSDSYPLPTAVPPRVRKETLKIAFLGRWDAGKGPDTLIGAVRALSGADVLLDLYGIVQDDSSRKFRDELQAQAGGDARIRFMEPRGNDQVIPLLRAYDLLAVPSRQLETGPLVVLEAQAAGVPVIGSNLGGIAELIESGVNGRLVEPGSVESWARCIREILEAPSLLESWRARVRPPRLMSDVAADMQRIYSQIKVATS